MLKPARYADTTGDRRTASVGCRRPLRVIGRRPSRGERTRFSRRRAEWSARPSFSHCARDSAYGTIGSTVSKFSWIFSNDLLRHHVVARVVRVQAVGAEQSRSAAAADAEGAVEIHEDDAVQGGVSGQVR